MTSILLRRRKLGNTSCREINNLSTTGIKAFRNDNPSIPVSDIVFRWGCTSNVTGNPKIINHAAAIHKVSDKAGFRMLTAAAGLAPESWASYESFKSAQQYPVVVRRATHHQGLFLHKCDNLEEVRLACDKYGNGNYYISAYIPKVAEYRVCFVSGRVVWVAKKTPADPNAVAWNVAQGGRFDNVNWDNWPLKAVKVSHKAFELSGLDFGGVDVMVNAAGECYVLEINSAPSLTSPYRQQCMAKAFDYIVTKGNANTIPMVGTLGGWKKFIHPAISSDAQMVA